MKDFIRKHIMAIIFSLLGAIGGFLYWKFIGCESGTCPIKSVWYLSTLWGLVFGYLLGSIIEDLAKRFKKKNKVEADEEPKV